MFATNRKLKVNQRKKILNFSIQHKINPPAKGRPANTSLDIDVCSFPATNLDSTRLNQNLNPKHKLKTI